MISCRAARDKMVEMLRGSASDAVGLEVESHLEGCAPCQQERARLGLMGALKEYTPPPLHRSAERRIVDGLIASARKMERSSLRRARRPWLWISLPALPAMAALLLLWAHHRSPSSLAVPAIVEGQVLSSVTEGQVAFAGAKVSYQAGTRMEFHPESRTVAMTKGEVDVDVTPGLLPGHFRVTTPKFIVEVLGTRFVVMESGVRTLRGTVRILDLGGHELALLHAGDEWRSPEGTALVAPAPVAAPIAAPVAAPIAKPVVPSAAQTKAVPSPSAPAIKHDRVKQVEAAELLGRAKSALSRGEVSESRALVARALESGPSEAEIASAGMLLADSQLVDKKPDEAITAYRRVVRQSPRSPEGEMASYAVGQLLFERGRSAEAEAALNEYLAHYPMGRFVREARDRLIELHSVR